MAEEKTKTKNQRIREKEEYEYQMKRTQEIEKRVTASVKETQQNITENFKQKEAL